MRNGGKKQSSGDAKAGAKAMPDAAAENDAALALFHPVTAAWFRAVFDRPTAPQRLGWPADCAWREYADPRSNRNRKDPHRFSLVSRPARAASAKDAETEGCRVVYISPLKALAVDVERNLRSPLAGIADMARQQGVAFHTPEISIRTGDTFTAGACTLSASSRGNPHHHAGVTVSASDLGIRGCSAPR